MLIYLRALHVVMNLVWVGSTLSLAALLTSGPGDVKQRGEAGRLLAKRLTIPTSALSLLFGLALLGLEPVLYFKATHFMHAKLPLALGAFGITHALGARARRMAEGQAQDAGPAGTLGAVFGLLALASALLALLKPFLSERGARTGDERALARRRSWCFPEEAPIPVSSSRAALGVHAERLLDIAKGAARGILANAHRARRRAGAAIAPHGRHELLASAADAHLAGLAPLAARSAVRFVGLGVDA